MIEAWKAVNGFEGMYEVSNLGRVRSLDRVCCDGMRRQGRVISPNVLRSGHLLVRLCDGPRTARRLVHRVVLEAFVGPCPDGMEGCHFPDRSPGNCRLDNLRWDTREGNKADMLQHGTRFYPRGEKNAIAKLTGDQVIAIRELAKTHKQKDIAARFGVSPSQVCVICAGRAWKHVQTSNPASIGSGNTVQ